MLIVAICVFCFSGYQLFEQTKDYRSGGKEYDKVEQEAVEIVSEETQESGTKEPKKEKKSYDEELESTIEINLSEEMLEPRRRRVDRQVLKDDFDDFEEFDDLFDDRDE